MSLTVHDKKTKTGAETDIDEDDKGDDKRNHDLGPPRFYDTALEGYYKRFDKSLQERADFKKRMKGQMTFTSTEWNQNVEKLGASQGNRPNKQVITVNDGMRKTLKQNKFEKADNLM